MEVFDLDFAKKNGRAPFQADGIDGTVRFILSIQNPEFKQIMSQIEKKLICLLRNAEMLEYAKVMMNYNETDRLYCEDEGFRLLKLSCQNEKIVQRKTPKSLNRLKIVLKVVGAFDNELIVRAITFEPVLHSRNHNECSIGVKIMLYDVECIPLIFVYFTLKVICSICENANLFLSNLQGRSDTEEKFFEVVLRSSRAYNEEYKVSFKKFIVELVNEIQDLKGKMRRTFGNAVIHKEFEAVANEKMSDLRLIGLLPSSLDNIEKYLDADDVLEITTKNIHILQTNDQTAKIYCDNGNILNNHLL